MTHVYGRAREVRDASEERPSLIAELKENPEPPAFSSLDDAIGVRPRTQQDRRRFALLCREANSNSMAIDTIREYGSQSDAAAPALS